MPRRIDACRQDRVVLHADFPDLPVVGNNRAAHVLASVELHPFGIVLLIVMTVDALSVCTFRAEHIVVNDTFVVVLQTTLVDSQLFVGDIRWRDESIADICVDAVGRDVDVEGLILCPLVIVLRVDFHLDGITLGTLCQPMPVVGIGLHLLAATNQFFVAGSQSGHHLTGVTVHLESQRCDVDRHGDVRVVGINGRQFLRLAELIRNLRSTGRHQRNCAAEYNIR